MARTDFALLMACFALANPTFCQELVQESVATENGFYDPVVRQVEGWTIRLDPALLTEENAELGGRVITALANHLQRIKYIVLPEKVAVLQELPIWIDLHNQKLSNMQYHPNVGWLKRNGHDPRLVKHVHIPRASRLLDPRQWSKHPYVVLHELAHSYHDQHLSWDHPSILRAYQAAKQAGTYEEVLAHSGRIVRHYGLNDHKEYFAEATEAYFGVNDFFPFVRAELKEHDPMMYETLEKIWGKIR